MSKLVDEAGLAYAIDLVSASAVYFTEASEDIITPNTRCYTKAEVDLKLDDLELKKLDREEYDKTLEEVLRATGYKDVEEFSEKKTYYKGTLVKKLEVDSNGEVIYRYYRFILNHPASVWAASDVVESSFYSELEDMRSSSSEEVTLVINSSDGSDLSSYLVSVTIDEEITLYPITEDPIVFEVERGKYYSISFPSIENYNSPEDVTLRALINQRLLLYSYTITPLEYETVTVAAKVTGGASTITDSTILEQFVGKGVYVTIDSNELLPYTLDSNLSCTFNIEWGRTYSVSFLEVTGYLLIYPTKNRVAALAERLITIVYEEYPSEMLVYANNGTTYTIDLFLDKFYDSDLKLYDKEGIDAEDFRAIFITNSTLKELNAEFYLPIKYTYEGTERYLHKTLTGSSLSYLGAQWSPNAVEFDSTRLPYLNPWNGDTTITLGPNSYKTAWRGDINTQVIGNIIEDSAGALSSPAYNMIMNSSLTINGQLYTPFLGAIALLKTMYDSCLDAIKMIINAVTGVSMDMGGYFWSSSLYNATYSWNLCNGATSSNPKTYRPLVVPFFALSPLAVTNS